MYIVAIAWLYLIGVLALTRATFIGGLALFIALGVIPLLLLASVAARRMRRMREARGSRLEGVVSKTDDRETQSDQ